MMANRENSAAGTASAELAALVLGMTDKLFVVYAANGRIAYFAPACETLTGVSEGAARGQSSKNFFAAFGQNEIVWQSFGPLNPKDFPKVSTECWSAAGVEPFWMNWVNNAVVNEAGAVDYVVAEGMPLDDANPSGQVDGDNVSIGLEHTILSLALTIQQRDPESAAHQARVAQFAAAISTALNIPSDAARDIFYAALLHDIGQVFVPQDILYQTGGLSGDEYSAIQRHARIGCDIMKSAQAPDALADVILHHHERYDGRGYPEGLSGDDIALGARIVAVADAAEAMLSPRPYRGPLSLEKALSELRDGRKSRFDPAVIDIATDLLEKGVFKFE